MTVPATNPDAAATGADVISSLAGVAPGSALADLREQRPEAKLHAQGSYDALFDPAESTGLTPAERFATALRVAAIHTAPEATSHYRQRLTEAGADQETAAETQNGRDGAPASQKAGALPPRLRAILRHADLLAERPRDASPDDLQALADAGLSTPEIVTLSQIIAFVSFQVRMIYGLRLLGGGSADGALATGPARSRTANGAGSQPAPVDRAPARIIRPGPDLNRPTAFTVDQLAWTPWIPPIELADATPRQQAALERRSGNSPYFRLLAHDPAVLVERTATDMGIFYTPGGAPRAERELAAAATSRLNGCIYCASVHARLSAQLSKRPEDIDRLLREGVTSGADLQLGDRWQGVVDLAVALARTPPAATTAHLDRLREIGFGELEILDVIQAAAFFSWANRLMLTLGEPHYE